MCFWLFDFGILAERNISEASVFFSSFCIFFILIRIVYWSIPNSEEFRQLISISPTQLPMIILISGHTVSLTRSEVWGVSYFYISSTVYFSKAMKLLLFGGVEEQLCFG